VEGEMRYPPIKAEYNFIDLLLFLDLGCEISTARIFAEAYTMQFNDELSEETWKKLNEFVEKWA
jgi:hypothetical protein